MRLVHDDDEQIPDAPADEPTRSSPRATGITFGLIGGIVTAPTAFFINRLVGAPFGGSEELLLLTMWVALGGALGYAWGDRKARDAEDASAQ